MTFYIAMCRLNAKLSRTKDHLARVALESACQAMLVSLHLDEASHLQNPLEVARESANTALCGEDASDEAIEAALAVVTDTLDESQEKTWIEKYLAERLN